MEGDGRKGERGGRLRYTSLEKYRHMYAHNHKYIYTSTPSHIQRRVHIHSHTQWTHPHQMLNDTYVFMETTHVHMLLFTYR